jgi:hypothetical protein
VCGKRRVAQRISYLLPLVEFVAVNFFSKCGSDGDRTFTYDFSVLKLHERQEIVDPIPDIQLNGLGLYSMPLTQIPQGQWAQLGESHANGESLRQLAKVYDVSYETVRQAIRRVCRTS